jgi:hypothetical protein
MVHAIFTISDRRARSFMKTSHCVMKALEALHRTSPATWWALGLVITLFIPRPAVGQQQDNALTRGSASIRVTFDGLQPGLSALSIDSLKHSSFRPSPIVAPGAPMVRYIVSERDGWTRYAYPSNPSHAVWELRCNGDTLRMRSMFWRGAAPQDLTWTFNLDVTHATLLGRTAPSGDIALPAVLHLPGMGSLRIYAKGAGSAALRYVAHQHPTRFVAVAFPAATAQHRLIEYTLQTAAIYPSVSGMDPGDTRFDGFRRDWLNALQLQAELHMLANNAASSTFAGILYQYSDIARYTPELVKGLTALDIVRESLDRYLGGYRSYGMPGFVESHDGAKFTDPRVKYVFLDVYPSLLISAYDYVDGSGDGQWLHANYPGLRLWAEIMIAPNADGSPLLEYPASGDSGSWGNPFTVRPSNWWDDIGFGHQDAYANALGYRALRSMAVLADRAGESADAARYRKRAQEIHDAYSAAFLDPAAGVIAGWRSNDGQLHDYFFPFVNGIAVRYGLIEGQQAQQTMNRILAKMDSVGFRDFTLGLPGNLVPIRRADYVDLNPRYGGPRHEDGSDSFQIYQNGGANACFAYFTLGALYHLGEKEQADKILLPMLDAFANEEFSGRAPDGLTYDFRDWHGGAHGYEGFLVDNYYTFLSVLDRANMLQRMP